MEKLIEGKEGLPRLFKGYEGQYEKKSKIILEM